MKFIPCANIKGGIIEAEIFLREQGILATDASNYANIPRYDSAARKIKEGIWVHLNHQYIDALKVLEDPDHSVDTALTAEQMKEIECSARQALFHASSRLFSKLATYILVSALIGLVVYVIYSVEKA